MQRPPRVEDVRRMMVIWTIVPLSLAGGLLGSVAISPILRLRNVPNLTPVPAWELVLYGFVTAAMCAAALGLPLRSKSPDRMGFRALSSCTVFGWLNCPACLLAWGISASFDRLGSGVVWGVVIALGFGLLVGLFIALPIGALYGAVAYVPMQMIGNLRLRPTLDALPRSVRIVALTVLPSSLFGAFVAYVSLDDRHASVPPWLLLIVGAGALIAYAWAERKLYRHRAWLARVADHAEPGWALLPAGGAAMPDMLALPPNRRGEVLVYSPEASPTYRTPEQRIFWASSGGNDSGDGGV